MRRRGRARSLPSRRRSRRPPGWRGSTRRNVRSWSDDVGTRRRSAPVWNRSTLAGSGRRRARSSGRPIYSCRFKCASSCIQVDRKQLPTWCSPSTRRGDHHGSADLPQPVLQPARTAVRPPGPSLRRPGARLRATTGSAQADRSHRRRRRRRCAAARRARRRRASPVRHQDPQHDGGRARGRPG
jgi:hypothetical protein